MPGKYKYFQIIRLKMHQPPSSREEFFNCIRLYQPHFLATISDVPQMMALLERNEFSNLTYSVTNVIDFKDEARIAYMKYPGQSQPFSYFFLFPSNLIMGLFLSLICVSIILSLKRWDFIEYIRLLLDTFVVMFSKEMPRSFKSNAVATRLIGASWLLSTMFISIIFCNLVLDEKVKAINPKVIDSLDDLYQRGDVQITVRSRGFLGEFAQHSDSPMALSFGRRLRILPFRELKRPGCLIDLAKNLSSGHSSFAMERMSMIFFLIKLNSFSKDNYLLKNLHISREGGPQLPYFLGSYDTNHKYLNDMNKM